MAEKISEKIEARSPQERLEDKKRELMEKVRLMSDATKIDNVKILINSGMDTFTEADLDYLIIWVACSDLKIQTKGPFAQLARERLEESKRELEQLEHGASHILVLKVKGLLDRLAPEKL